MCARNLTFCMKFAQKEKLRPTWRIALGIIWVHREALKSMFMCTSIESTQSACCFHPHILKKIYFCRCTLYKHEGIMVLILLCARDYTAGLLREQGLADPFLVSMSSNQNCFPRQFSLKPEKWKGWWFFKNQLKAFFIVLLCNLFVID